MNIATQSEIITFLEQFKFFAQNLSCFSFIEREKNMQTITELGISIAQAVNVILELTYKNYVKGPSLDRDRPGQNVWEFGCYLDNNELYIKLSNNFKYGIAKCISFHKANFSITYPYSEREVS